MRYFSPREFLPLKVFEKFGAAGMRYINPKIPVIMDFLREQLGKRIVINDWAAGGDFQYRGLRTPDSSVYSQFSDHAFGNAVDFHVADMSAEAVQDKIKFELADDLIVLGLTGIEDATPTWTHLSVSDLEAWDFKIINGIKIIPYK